jgi:HEAT repeat protein
VELVGILKDKDSDDNMRWTAVSSLQNMQGQAKKILPILKEMIKAENDVKIRTFAVHAMARIGNDALPLMLDLIKTDKDDGVRAAALQVLGNYGYQSKEAVAPLIDCLKDKSAQVRWSAAYALQRMGNNAKQAIPTLAELLKDSDTNVRQHAFYALCNMVPDSLPALASGLKDGDSNLRWQTLNNCTNHNYCKKEMVPGLIACLKDQNINVRHQACKLLGQLGKDATEAVKPLRELLNDPNPAVSTAAQAALTAIEPKKK